MYLCDADARSVRVLGIAYIQYFIQQIYRIIYVRAKKRVKRQGEFFEKKVV